MQDTSHAKNRPKLCVLLFLHSTKHRSGPTSFFSFSSCVITGYDDDDDDDDDSSGDESDSRKHWRHRRENE
jgi:hypothetical protein